MELFLFLFLGAIFWGCVFLIGHSYVLYPLLMKWKLGGRELPEERFTSDDELPEVAVLMAVYNEDSVLERTLSSIWRSDYPREKLQVFIGSDGSTDRSHEIITRFQARFPALHLRVFPGRNGKIRIINHLSTDAEAALCDPDKAILILCDANVAWAPGALQKMVRHFKREKVGLVGARVVDSADEHEGIGHEENAYVGMENGIKNAEGILWGNMMGAFGACYALRARLFEKVPESYIVDDFFQTMSCIESGSEAIVDLDAVCFESVSTEIGEEFRRKTRIATGNFQNLTHFWKLISPGIGKRKDWFAFWSHKGIRWIGPLLLIGAILSCTLLAFLSSFYLIPVAGIVATFLAAFFDALMGRKPGGRYIKPFRFIRYFYLMNAALLAGFFDFLKGEQNSVWEPTKRVASSRTVAKRGTAVEP